MTLRRVAGFIGQHAILVALAVMFSLPFFFMLLQSVMPLDQAKTTALWPRTFEWGNYVEVFNRVPLLTYVRNTLLVCTLVVVGTIVSCVPVAYAFSHLRWRGRGVVFVLILSTMMLPFQVLFVSQYQIFSWLGWLNTLLPLTVPAFFANAFSIFLLRQFFLTLPTETLDAARVDGADFFGPNIYLSDEENLTLAVGLVRLNTAAARLGESNLTMAAAVMFVIPLIAIFFFAQKIFIEGVTLTGSKG
jgi:multiple sugar transport system permease protein